MFFTNIIHSFMSEWVIFINTKIMIVCNLNCILETFYRMNLWQFSLMSWLHYTIKENLFLTTIIKTWLRLIFPCLSRIVRACRPSPLLSPPDSIQCLHTADKCKFFSAINIGVSMCKIPLDGLVSMSNGISTLFRLFDAKAILLEEQ